MPNRYPVPLPSSTPGTQHYSPSPSEQWPAVSARPPSVLSLKSRNSYATAPLHAPSLPSVVGRAHTPPLADYLEDVYSPGVAVSRGTSDSYRSQNFDSAASGYTSDIGSGYSRVPRPREFVSPPPILNETSMHHKYKPYAIQLLNVMHAAGLRHTPMVLPPLCRSKGPNATSISAPYHQIVPQAMLPTLPPFAPGASDVMVYTRCNGGSSPDVESS